MAGFLSEKLQMDLAVLTVGIGDATAGMYSKKFDLKDYKKVTILCGNEGIATGAVLAGATFNVLVGMASQGPTSFAALTGATLVLGSSVSSIVSKAEEVLIWVHNSITTGRTIIINGTTWTCNDAAGATLADYQLGATIGTAFRNCIASACAAGMLPGVTYVNTTNVASASTGFAILLRTKDRGAGFVGKGVTVQVTANVTATGFELRPNKYFGVIEFEAQDVLATNSSYTHFAIQVQSSVTAANRLMAVVLREPCYPSTWANRVQL